MTERYSTVAVEETRAGVAKAVSLFGLPAKKKLPRSPERARKAA
jgi:hypothetical protein